MPSYKVIYFKTCLFLVTMCLSSLTKYENTGTKLIIFFKRKKKKNYDPSANRGPLQVMIMKIFKKK